MNVNIITLGKLRENYFKEASAEYEKRLSAYCKLKIIELEPSKPIIKIPKSFCTALCSEGEKYTSEEFAEKLLRIGQNLSFIIGSSEGLAESIKSSADLKLSLSDMTFPYQLARIMLLEQIYRAFSINNNGKYHK
ncbi:MAG: 23S rRNA (pseudouridine(1915)-N(3))-methyltransferase RlmH [Oscillospiraceae bacterium]|jgi:23S rRNA (pseudouridine1915-N3)-methyltransferase|nr:23S rRNA (pseudouridine(1915)-N(3))-methyltransferase RlmH [Oscillospiraceae bacterium]